MNQLLTTVTVTPVGNTSQITGKTAQFSMGQALDQFGRPMAVSPVLLWSAPVTLLNAPAPSFATSGSITTVTFAAAGPYMLSGRLPNATTASFTTTVVVTPTLAGVSIKTSGGQAVSPTRA